MDTCSRLREPGGVKWKNVNVGRLRTTISEAVELVASNGRSIGSVAKELGLRDSVLRRWVEQRGLGGPTAEIARLQRENVRLRMEREILKKSIAIFAGVPK